MIEIVVLEKSQLIELATQSATIAAEKVLREVYKPIKEVMDIEEVAAYLGVHPNTVREKIKTKGLPVNTRLGFKRFYRSEVDAWMRSSE